MPPQRIALCLIALVALLGAACVHHVPHISSMNFDANSMEYVGPVQAEGRQIHFLCAIPTAFREPLPYALDAKAKSMGADAVINVIAETESGALLGVFCWQEIRLTGVAVRFKPSARHRPPARVSHEQADDSGWSNKALQRPGAGARTPSEKAGASR